MKKIFENKFLLFIVVAFFIRIYFIFLAYHGDLNNNISWGVAAFNNGLKGFYDAPPEGRWLYSAPNQPPLTILLFYSVRALWEGIYKISWLINNSIKMFPSGAIWFWERWGMILLVKLPSIIADFGIAYWIHKLVKVITQDTRKAKILSIVWLFNPVIWYNSAIWGQTDSIVNLLGISAIGFLLDKKIIKFSIYFTLAFLFKGSLLIFVPILMLIIFNQRYSFKILLKAFLASILIIVSISIWFHPSINFPLWIIDLYKTRIIPGEIGYLTANAFNLWWLVNPGKVLDSQTYLNISYRTWGFVMSIFSIGLLSFFTLKKYSKQKAIIALALSGLISFLFLTRVHERYLYPFFPYATIIIAFVPQMIYIYLLLIISHLINLYNLFWYPSFPILEDLLKKNTLPNLLAMINILCLALLVILFRYPKKLNSS